MEPEEGMMIIIGNDKINLRHISVRRITSLCFLLFSLHLDLKASKLKNKKKNKNKKKAVSDSQEPAVGHLIDLEGILKLFG